MTATLTASSITALPFGADTIDAIDTYLEATLPEEISDFSGSVVVSRGAGTGITRSYGLANREHWVPNTTNTKFRIASITKQFTAAAILQLQQHGLLDLQFPIAAYLPHSLQNKNNSDHITIHHLLTHSAGIPNCINPELFPDIAAWLRLPATLEQAIARFKDLPLVFEPGAAFLYSNSGYVLLTQIIETVSGQSYADYMQVNLFEPLGMNNTGYEMPKAVIPNLAQGYFYLGAQSYLQAEPIDMSLPQGAGGLYSTVEDLATWHQWLYRTPAKQSLLSSRSIALLTKPMIAMDLDRPSPDAFYGYGLVHDSYLGHQVMHHSGSINGFASALTYCPEEQLTVGVLTNVENVPVEKVSKNLAAIVFEKSREVN
ncbi:MAG: serine hydrolase domain-containing protein [Cyanobacteria bacterium P01_D01_bin.1]